MNSRTSKVDVEVEEEEDQGRILSEGQGQEK